MAGDLDRFLRKHLNFFRVHLLYVTFTPLIFSAIFYASNGKNPVSYVDCLFLCFSAMTVCGLATIDLSLLTPWQQVIIFVQMCLGSPVFVSWFIVYFRRYYFAKKFDHLLEAAAERKAEALKTNVVEVKLPWSKRLARWFTGTPAESQPRKVRRNMDEKSPNGLYGPGIRPDMIRRVDDAPKLVDPSGWISQGLRSSSPPRTDGDSDFPRHLSFADSLLSPDPRAQRHSKERSISSNRASRGRHLSRRLSDPGAPPRPDNSRTGAPMSRFETVSPTVATFSPLSPRDVARTQTIEFAPSTVRRRGRQLSEVRSFDRSSVRSGERRSMRRPSIGVSMGTYPTVQTHMSERRTKHSGFGGFPMPHEILGVLMERLFPKFKRKLTRTVTIPATTTITSQRGDLHDGARAVPYISFPAVVGRNSAFHLLDESQMEELGGVEYRALKALLWIIPMYHVGIQLLGFMIVSAYLHDRYSEAFQEPTLHRALSRTWFSLFQVVSAYTNTGMSLVDQSMIPFQNAYGMVIVLAYLILAGNTCYPIFLRFTIWMITKLVPRESKLNETLHFLLDHPRRCYIYLFPSHQTWFLLTVVIWLTATDWLSFMILDIGTPVVEAIEIGTRFCSGLFQAIAVRSSGFAIVLLSGLAPAVKFLYVLMMYVSVYPIAMSVRSTNVYEEKSLGIFAEDDEDEDEDEHDFPLAGSRMTVWSRYLTMHARRQLSFDMWWLSLALFLLCVIERGSLVKEENYGWFNIFTLIFELVSAYGTVGLSLGIPTGNFSFAGVLQPLSKVIICIVMLRGRHRGLPVAIDRAIMLPAEFQTDAAERQDEDDDYTPEPQPVQQNEKLPDIGEAQTPPRVSISDVPVDPERD